MRTITAKLGTMRKAREWVVQVTSNGRIMIQADKAIGLFNPSTGEGLLNTNGGYGPHLHPALGAKRFTFPRDFIEECQAALDANGPETALAGGAVIIKNTVEEI